MQLYGGLQATATDHHRRLVSSTTVVLVDQTGAHVRAHVGVHVIHPLVYIGRTACRGYTRGILYM